MDVELSLSPGTRSAMCLMCLLLLEFIGGIYGYLGVPRLGSQLFTFEKQMAIGGWRLASKPDFFGWSKVGIENCRRGDADKSSY